ncbi:MAG: DoxX family protein [Betaproteobacteria bacterium]|nr:DoxX family protein [Betaproteobacteria bacterium]
MRFDDAGKLLLRLLVGGLLFLHGWHKIWTGPHEIEAMLAAHRLPWYLAYGVYIGEVLAPVLLILGFYTRIGGFLVLVDLIVAVALTRGANLLHLNAHGGWIIELEAFYGLSALAIVLLGPGRYSLDGA